MNNLIDNIGLLVSSAVLITSPIILYYIIYLNKDIIQI